jgi:hypothetical protein
MIVDGDGGDDGLDTEIYLNKTESTTSKDNGGERLTLHIPIWEMPRLFYKVGPSASLDGRDGGELSHSD